jgi:cyanophycin synthetase
VRRLAPVVHTAPKTMSPLSFSSKWRWLNGHSHGLPQRTLIGQARVRSPAQQVLSTLDDLLSRVVPVAELPPAEGTGGQALVRRFFWWVGEIQRHARLAVSPDLHLRALAAPDPQGYQVFEVALPCRSTNAHFATMRWLEAALAQALPGAPAAAVPIEDSLRQLLDSIRPKAEPGYNQLHLLLAAYRMGLCVRPLAGQLLRLGTGARARLLESSVTDQTPSLGLQLAQNKWLTARLLLSIGVPGTVNDRVKTADDAVALAHRLGWPVVVKPADKDQGLGVSAHLVSDDSVRQAFAAAQAASPNVLVERHVQGFGHRLTLHDGELLAVLKRIPGGVRGDGQHRVAELVALQLASPEVRRQRNMGRVHLDAEALGLLAERGQGPDTVPAAGEFVLLRRRDNISAGGRLERIDPATVHPDNLLAAQRAARALHLDVAGIDFISPDITRSWRDNGAAICEVNARPQFGAGERGDNYDRLLLRLLGDPPQIPVHLYLCRGADEPGLLHTLQALRDRLGARAISLRSGVWLMQTPLCGPQPNGWQAARAALSDRDVPSLLMALSPTEIIAEGLPLPRIDSLHLAAGRDADWPAAERAVREQAVQWCACTPTLNPATATATATEPTPS